MGCSQSSYPLPSGKFHPDHPKYAPNFPIPNQIDVQRAALKGRDSQQREEEIVATVHVVRSPKLSPLRELINTQEVARPQSEETKMICERLTTELLTSVTTESLSVIQEDDVMNAAPKSFEMYSLEHDSVNGGHDDDSMHKEEQEMAETTYRFKLNESALIDVLAIESKIDQLESLMNANPSVKRNDMKMQLVDESLNDKTTTEMKHMAAYNNKLKDRVRLLVLICLLFIYLSAFSVFGWMGLQAFQSLRYLVAPAPRLMLHDYIGTTKMLVNNFNNSEYLGDERAKNIIHTNNIIRASQDPVTMVPNEENLSEHLDRKSRLLRSVATGVSKGAGHELSLALDADAKINLREKYQRLSVKMKQQSASVVGNIERNVANFKERVSYSQTLSTVIITLKEVSDIVDSGYYFI